MAVVLLVLGYLLGSLPTGLLVVRALTGQGIRAIGRGNLGTVNVYRVTRYASLASLLGMISVPVTMWWRREPPAYLVFGLITLTFAVYRHRANLARLISGTELRVTDKPGGS